ncbi:hypothetical protein BX265_2324 [Streptomyces sp. TLI_235]|nr:hypothetical protein [Streptomyces sp. TLI_235]PBC77573.1 hypothetical protein BX265_2324 [Streptomyces sp. TLI_235]
MSGSNFYEERRKDRRMEAELRLQAEQAAAERKAAAAERAADQDRKDKAADQARRKREQADRAQRAAERRAAVKTWLLTETVTVFLLGFIAVAVVSAFHGQYGALTHMGISPMWAALIGAAIESATWVTTLLGDEDAKKGRPTGPMRTAMWTFAAIAASFNLVDGLNSAHPQQGFALAFLTPAAVYMWDARQRRRHGIKLRTKAERAEEKDRRRHEKTRKAKHPELWKTAALILADAEHGKVTFEEAWAVAREIHRGTREAGLTPELVTLRAESKARMADALALETGAEPMFPDTVPADWTTAYGDTFGTVYRSPLSGPQDGGKDTDGTVLPRPSGGPPEGPGALGRKGQQPVPKGGRKTPQKPLDPKHIEQIRKLAEALGGVDKLSARNVREAIGGGATEYAIRLRDAVKNQLPE